MSIRSNGECEAQPRGILFSLACGKASLTALESGEPLMQDQRMLLLESCARITSVSASLFIFLTLGFTQTSTGQEFLPSPPADRSLIYFLDEQNKFVPLPFEPGQTSLHPEQIARSTKVSFIELKGEHAATIFKSDIPRLFLFMHQRTGTHPPFLVRLTPRHGARKVTAITQRGLSGFAISSEEIIKPSVRVLANDGDQVFVEVRPRGSLMAGEYAIIGDDLARIATFRVMSSAER